MGSEKLTSNSLKIGGGRGGNVTSRFSRVVHIPNKRNDKSVNLATISMQFARAQQESMRPDLLVTVPLDLPPSCIAFVPSHPTDFLVGTYHLKDPGSNEGVSETRRDGSLSLFRMTDDEM